jgi:hypothetical protein
MASQTTYLSGTSLAKGQIGGEKTMAMLALVGGLLMTAVAVMIGGFALELALVAISRGLSAATPDQTSEPTGTAVVVNFKALEATTGTLEWAEEAAA